MSEQDKGKIVPEYWGIFIIIDILNVAKCVIEHHVILRVNMPCDRVQDHGDATGMSRTTHKEDSAPGLWLPVRKFLTV